MRDLADRQLFENLLDVSRALAENRTLDPLLHYAMTVALDLFEGENGYLVLVQPDGSLDFRIRLDKDGRLIEQPESRISHTLLDKVIERRKSAVIADAMIDPNTRTAQSVIALRLRSVMCSPLIARGEVLGAIYIENRSSQDAFNQDDLKALEYFAAQAAVAIANAMLNDELEQRVNQRTAELRLAMETLEDYNRRVVDINHRLEAEIAERERAQEELQRLAITDALTGVFNRRHFFTLGEQEIKEAQRYQSALAALMIDVDFFKLVNDRYGHAAGDQVLQRLAAYFLRHVRAADVLARYGGEEFVMLLPHTMLEEARQLAERLRQGLVDAPLQTSSGPVALTLSIGVAALNLGQDESIDLLIARADQAMYTAKQSGRNQVKLAEEKGVE